MMGDLDATAYITTCDCQIVEPILAATMPFAACHAHTIRLEISWQAMRHEHRAMPTRGSLPDPA